MSIKKPTNKQQNLAAAFMYFTFAPHEKDFKLIKFIDDYDTFSLHKDILNFSFLPQTTEMNEVKELAEWISSESKDYSSYVKVKHIK